MGRRHGGGVSPPPNATFARRWAIQPLPADPERSVVIQVLATPNFARGAADTGVVTRLPGEARLVTVRTRRR